MRFKTTQCTQAHMKHDHAVIFLINASTLNEIFIKIQEEKKPCACFVALTNKKTNYLFS